MDELLIGPWAMEMDATIHGDLFVPDYITEIGKEVLTHYDFSWQSMEVMATKPFKGGVIWRVETSAGPKSLKLLHRRPARSLFSLGAQEYLVDVQKAKVPPIVKTKDGQNYVEAGGKLWFVAEWIQSLTPVSDDLEGTKELVSALGEFHRLTKGYIPPKGAEVATRLTKWPKKYEKMIRKMDWFRNIALAYPELPASSLLLQVLDTFEEQARNSLERLNQSPYFDLVQKGNEYWGLVHQDYGWSNGQKADDGMWVIDLDGVAYDLPIRDLRKLIQGKMSGLNRWDASWIREMINAYHETNPITPELYDILMIELSLPDEFYKNIKEMVYEPEVFLNEGTASMLQSIVELEESKWPVLDEIKNDWKGVKA
ncbi:CotS family spore coat protein [Niallia sp. XMNu-256]|uniref:CotS family spore coat protein n=1 Tax=Niallia sp. XMNu-256 TaxID=3082444 RepID=UPI0030CD43F8